MIKNYLTIFFLAMVPIFELRGAIPVSQFLGLPIVPSFIICIVANMIPVPIIYLFARKVLIWGADKPVIGKFFSFCLEKGEKGGKKLQEKAGRGTFIALLLLLTTGLSYAYFSASISKRRMIKILQASENKFIF